MLKHPVNIGRYLSTGAGYLNHQQYDAHMMTFIPFQDFFHPLIPGAFALVKAISLRPLFRGQAKIGLPFWVQV